MTATEMATVCDFEDALAEGSEVLVRWTNNFIKFKGTGTVVRVNARSVRVRLTQHVPDPHSSIGYLPGREIVVPLLDNIKQWTCHNRVEPVGGYQPTAEKTA